MPPNQVNRLYGADPRVGAGEASVLKSKVAQPPTQGYQALERAVTRQEVAQRKKRKSNREYLQWVQEQAEDIHRTDEAKKKEIFDQFFQEAKKRVSKGENLLNPEFQAIAEDVISWTQKSNKKKELVENVNQQKNQLGDYVNADKWAALNIERINNTNPANLDELQLVDSTDEEVFQPNRFVRDYVKNIEKKTLETETRLKNAIQKQKHSYRFMKTDDNGNPTGESGLDESVFQDLMEDEQYSDYAAGKAEKKLREEAIRQKEKGLHDEDKPIDEIMNDIRTQPAQGEDYQDMEEKFMYETVWEDLKPYQAGEYEKTFKKGYKTDEDDKSSGLSGTDISYSLRRDTTDTFKALTVDDPESDFPDQLVNRNYKSWVPSVMHLDQQKMSNITVEPDNMMDIEAIDGSAILDKNKLLKEQRIEGDISFRPLQVERRPVKEGKEGREVAVVGNKDDIINSDNVQYDLVVKGRYTYEAQKEGSAEGETEERETTVYVPYKNISGEMEATFGIKENDVRQVISEDSEDVLGIEEENNQEGEKQNNQGTEANENQESVNYDPFGLN